jgi:hypothetical protein
MTRACAVSHRWTRINVCDRLSAILQFAGFRPEFFDAHGERRTISSLDDDKAGNTGAERAAKAGGGRLSNANLPLRSSFGWVDRELCSVQFPGEIWGDDTDEFEVDGSRRCGGGGFVGAWRASASIH